jgi:pantoate--beta-alanine ligase
VIEIVKLPSEMQARAQRWRAEGQRIAFVPTMGYLHAGHVSLLEEGRRRADILVLSIFVNPTQFGPREDLDAYPRDEPGDLHKAESAGVDVAFCPLEPVELFPPTALTWVYVEGLQGVLCGRTRPDHFRGVCTVCAKLWNLIRPDLSVFGEKDFQQLAILRRMHADLHLSGEIVSVPTVREADGLAMSSRNANLSLSARSEALAIPGLLRSIESRFAQGERRVDVLLSGAVAALAPGRVDYVEIRDAHSLAALDTVRGPARCAVAAWYGGVRLIDNVVLDPG